jgi:hypothetical protein
MPPKKNNNLNIDKTLSNANKSNVDKSDILNPMFPSHRQVRVKNKHRRGSFGF